MGDTFDHDDDDEPKQRRVDLPNRPASPPPLDPGARVRVYHKRNTTMFLTDCKIGPHEERDILESDLLIPNVAEHIVRIAG